RCRMDLVVAVEHDFADTIGFRLVWHEDHPLNAHVQPTVSAKGDRPTTHRLVESLWDELKVDTDNINVCGCACGLETTCRCALVIQRGSLYSPLHSQFRSAKRPACQPGVRVFMLSPSSSDRVHSARKGPPMVSPCRPLHRRGCLPLHPSFLAIGRLK